VVGCCAARPVRHGKSYTCLNPNLRSDCSGSRGKERLTTRAVGAEKCAYFLGDLYQDRRWIMNPFKGMSGVPKTRYHRLYYRTMGSPTEREF